MKEIWNKKVDDLTFGDTIKIQLAAAGLGVAAMAAFTGITMAVTAVQDRRNQKAEDREQGIIDATVVED